MSASVFDRAKELFRIEKPFAITMWEFSWIERRWPGAGYEDWDQALSQLTDRGYDAVRIDPFPHLLAKDPDREWTLNPVWNVQAWGSCSVNRIRLRDDLRNFLKACRRHHVRVGFSTWFREDVDRTLMDIHTPQDHANIWIKTLQYVEEWGELDNILYVDLCNEWPLAVWAPFFTRNGEHGWDDKESLDWMRAAVAEFKRAYPSIPVTFSSTFSLQSPQFHMGSDVSFLDFLEPHIWMTNSSGFYEKVGYGFERFDDIGYTNMALHGEEEYRAHRERYDESLVKEIEAAARWARHTGKPLVTTECWSVVDYKDWPLLNWDWILDLNRLGVTTAAKTGCWAGMATSNFCGPQFVGMWRELDWHREMTGIIHGSEMR